MGIRKYNPTTPGRRGASVSDFAELTPGAKPEKKLTRIKRRTGGRNNQGKITARHRGGGHKRRYRLIDFRRDKDGVPAVVDSIQYDPEPQRPDRPAALRRRREALHPGSRRPEGGRPRCSAARTRRRRWATACRCRRFRWARTSTTSRLQPGRGGVLCRSGRRQRDAGRPRRRLGPDQPAQRRNPPRAGEVPGDDRQDRQRGPHEHRVGQGRAEAVAGAAAARPRHGHEPDRPSARRRRRPDQGRPSSGQPHRQAGQGRLDAKAAQAVEQGDRSPAAVAALRRVETAQVGPRVSGKPPPWEDR